MRVCFVILRGGQQGELPSAGCGRRYETRPPVMEAPTQGVAPVGGVTVKAIVVGMAVAILGGGEATEVL